jgi:hypothetical protein
MRAVLHVFPRHAPALMHVMPCHPHAAAQMKASMAELQPPEVRILKHLLSMEDPLERQSGMEQAFTPGPELNAGQEDMLSTCVAQEQRVCGHVLLWLREVGVATD